MWWFIRLDLLSLVFAVSFIFSCQNAVTDNAAETNSTNWLDSNEPLFQSIPDTQSHLIFTNRLTDTEDQNYLSNFYYYNGGGVAIIDYDNDGWQDIFLTANQAEDRLFRNEKGMRFTDVTTAALGAQPYGWSTGVTVADVNADDLPDIYVSRAGSKKSKSPNLLYLNNGDGTFAESASEFGIADTGLSSQACFFDANADGLIDLFVVNFPADFHLINNIFYGGNLSDRAYGADRLYINTGNNQFVERSAEAGIKNDKAFGLNVLAADLNEDGFQDLYVDNDFWEEDFLYVNNGDGTFNSAADDYFKKVSLFSMGADAADINNDGFLDLLSVDMLPGDAIRRKTKYSTFPQTLYTALDKMDYLPQFSRNMLHINQAGKGFSEIAYLAGIAASDWSWSCHLADFDNDGLKDAFVTNGIRRDVTDLDYQQLKFEGDIANFAFYKTNKLQLLDSMPRSKLSNQFFKNSNGMVFERKTKEAGIDFGINSYGSAIADLDNDGDLDIVVNALDTSALLLENRANQLMSRNWLRIELASAEFGSNYGSRLKVYTNESMQLAELTNVRGFQSRSEDVMHFGLGSADIVDSLWVYWTDGTAQKITNITANQQLLIQKNSTSPAREASSSTRKLFEALSLCQPSPCFEHREKDFNDFARNRIIPMRSSKDGPAIAVADVNLDGFDDFFIGGAKGQEGQILLQDQEGNFSNSGRLVLEDRTDYEDQGALFFDANNDGFPDLFISSGSSEFEPGDQSNQDRFYLNDGLGNMQLIQDAIPENLNNSTSVSAADVDADGDLDLFIGGGVISGRYPEFADSRLLINENGKFNDQTEKYFDSRQMFGLVRSAIFSDYDSDGDPDLWVAAHYQPLQIYRNEGGYFSNQTEALGFGGTEGWWNSLTPADVDNDGDLDLVAGNWGLNHPYKTSDEQPIVLYSGDFDQNYAHDAFLTYIWNDRRLPFVGRNEFCTQMPKFNNDFTTFKAYAAIDLEQLVSADPLHQTFPVRRFESSVFMNENGSFKRISLPVQAQVSPIFGVLAIDLNDDHHLDLLVSGNAHNNYYEIGNSDASNGLVLFGMGDGTFQPAQWHETGFRAHGDAKALALLQGGKQQPIVIQANNHATMQAFKLLKQDLVPLRYDHTTRINKVKLSDGSVRVIELQLGSGYLSQSSPCYWLPKGAVPVE